MPENIGMIIKQCRTGKKMSLRDLGDKCSLSASYLSMVERGLTSISITSLQNVAKALEVSTSVFFDSPPPSTSYVLRSHERPFVLREGTPGIYYSLASEQPEGQGQLEPVILQLPPEKTRTEMAPYSHEGEEFIYVIEGIVTLWIENTVYELYPEDSYHIMSYIPHVIRNFSNRMARILCVNTPRFFTE